MEKTLTVPLFFAFLVSSIQLSGVDFLCALRYSAKKKKSESHSVVSLSATLWTVACKAPLFMGFSRQEYGSGLPFPSLRDRPDPGIKLQSPAFQADSLLAEPP